MKIIYLGLPGTGRQRCSWTLNLLGIEIVDDFNQNQMIEGQIECLMNSGVLLNWEEADCSTMFVS